MNQPPVQEKVPIQTQEPTQPKENQIIIKVENVTKTFGLGTTAVNDVSFSVEKGEFVFLVGPTGSGKTTLFRLLIRDLPPSKGHITVEDFNLVKMPSKKIPQFRRKIGVVFQNLRLLSDRTIFENIILPLEVTGLNQNEAKKRVDEIMTQIKILDHKYKFPIQLSGGELQRVAIARALILHPPILFADEPTGELDPTTGDEILKLLIEINKNGTTILMATHNPEFVNSMQKRVIALESGKIVRDEKKGKYHAS